MANSRKTQGITKPIYEMKKVKRSGKTKYKQVSEQRGRRLMEKGAKNNPVQSFDSDSQEYDINKSKSITRYGNPSQYMGAKIGQMLGEISTGSNDAWLKAMDQSGISPVKNKITPSPLIEASGDHDIPAGEQGGYSTEPAQHYDESVSTPVKEMGNVDIEDIHKVANEPPTTTSQKETTVGRAPSFTPDYRERDKALLKIAKELKIGEETEHGTLKSVTHRKFK